MDINDWRGIVGDYYYCNKGSDKLLVTIGDSWTAGQGALESKWESVKDFKWYMRANQANYPFYLAERLDCDFLNLGYPGNSNQAAYVSLLETCKYYSKYKEVLVSVGLTGSMRDMAILEDKKYPTGIMFGHSHENLTDEQNTFMKYYNLTLNNAPSNFCKYIQNIASIQNFCKANSYDIIMFQAFIDDLNVKDEDIGIYQRLRDSIDYSPLYTPAGGDMYSMLRIEEKKTGEVLMSECDHPNSKGYKIIADLLYDALQKRKL